MLDLFTFSFTFFLPCNYSSCVNRQLSLVLLQQHLKDSLFQLGWSPNPRTSAWQSLWKFTVSLCGVFLNMGSNILWSILYLNFSSDYLLTDYKCSINVFEQDIVQCLLCKSWTEKFKLENWCENTTGRGVMGRGSGNTVIPLCPVHTFL